VRLDHLLSKETAAREPKGRLKAANLRSVDTR
jgi:hypothetical protein